MRRATSSQQVATHERELQNLDVVEVRGIFDQPIEVAELSQRLRTAYEKSLLGSRASNPPE